MAYKIKERKSFMKFLKLILFFETTKKGDAFQNLNI